LRRQLIGGLLQAEFFDDAFKDVRRHRHVCIASDRLLHESAALIEVTD
jgi:hypothetical protein